MAICCLNSGLYCYKKDKTINFYESNNSEGKLVSKTPQLTIIHFFSCTSLSLDTTATFWKAKSSMTATGLSKSPLIGIVKSLRRCKYKRWSRLSLLGGCCCWFRKSPLPLSTIFAWTFSCLPGLYIMMPKWTSKHRSKALDTQVTRAERTLRLHTVLYIHRYFWDELSLLSVAIAIFSMSLALKDDDQHFTKKPIQHSMTCYCCFYIYILHKGLSICWSICDVWMRNVGCVQPVLSFLSHIQTRALRGY